MSVKNLNSINTSEWPFPMILDRLITKFLSLFLSGKHTVVSAVSLAVPSFPPLVKWLLQIAWIINVVTIRKIAVLKTFASHASSLLTLFNARSDISENLMHQNAWVRRNNMSESELIREHNETWKNPEKPEWMKDDVAPVMHS